MELKLIIKIRKIITDTLIRIWGEDYIYSEEEKTTRYLINETDSLVIGSDVVPYLFSFFSKNGNKHNIKKLEESLLKTLKDSGDYDVTYIYRTTDIDTNAYIANYLVTEKENVDD